MKKMKPFKEKPGLKRFETNIYWAYGKKEATQKMVAPTHDIAVERIMRMLNLQFKRDHVVVVGTTELGRAH